MSIGDLEYRALKNEGFTGTVDDVRLKFYSLAAEQGIFKAILPDGIIPVWSFLKEQWTTEPTLVGRATSPVAGDVYSYTLAGVTRFRLVPDAYTPAEDAFYSSFSAGACTGLITRRGQ